MGKQITQLPTNQSTFTSKIQEKDIKVKGKKGSIFSKGLETQ